MAYVTAIVMLALVQYFYFSIEVGRARGRCGVPAPAISGNDEFERYFRVPVSYTHLTLPTSDLV